MRHAKLLAAVLTSAAVLALPAGAPAKEISSLAACGLDGCRGIEGEQAKRGFEQAVQTGAPERAEPFLSVNVRIRVAEDEGPIPGFTVRYLTRSGVLRSSDEHGSPFYTQPPPALASALKRAAGALRPKPASRLGPLEAPAAAARVDEVFEPAAPAAAPESGAGAPTAVVLALAAGGLALALGAATSLRRRRRGRAAPGTPATS